MAHVSIDQDWAERSLSEGDLSAGEEPEVMFDRHWAHSLLASVSKRLAEHYDSIGKREVYEAIKGCLEGDGNYGESADIAAEIGMSSEGVRSAVFKLRRRFREYLEEAARDTCTSADEARDEIVHLCRILAQ